MGLQHDLGYEHRRANAPQRLMQRVAASRPGAWLFSRILPPLDRLALRLSHGRIAFPRLLAGLPVLTLTSTGARTGLPRTTPLIAVPAGDDLALIGTSFGQPATPAWVHNLEANPHAALTFGDRTVPVDVRRAEPEEAAAIMTASRTVYEGYARYQARITDREVRVFIATRSACD